MANPVHEIRRGLVKARIWRRKTRAGTRYGIAVVRLFRNGDTWKESSRFGRDDIPVMRLVLDLAHTWILHTASAQRSAP
jgi:hypothetical protein